MDCSYTRWFATVDETMAKLFSAERTPLGRIHVSHVDTHTNRWRDQHQHGRPSMLGQGPSASASQHFAAPGHDEQEQRDRFAKEVLAWTELKAHQFGAEHIRVFASARMLGSLRQRQEAKAVITELNPLDLGSMTTDELAKHHAVEELIDHKNRWSGLHTP